MPRRTSTSAGRRRSPVWDTPAPSSGRIGSTSPRRSAATARRSSGRACTATSIRPRSRRSKAGGSAVSTSEAGKVLWDQTACKGVPKVKRHPKASHANPTPATDGAHVVASFGSEGLYCYDRDGKLLWQKSLGVLDSGWFYDADYQWGFASSPILYKDLAIVQCDVGKGFVHRGLPGSRRQGGLAEVARRNPVVGHADHRREALNRVELVTERDQVCTRLRPADRRRAVAPGTAMARSRCRRRSSARA